MSSARKLTFALLGRVTAVVFVLPLLPVRFKLGRRFVAVLLSLCQVYVVTMHLYLMDRYWLHIRGERSQGLYIELLLHVSSALTFPLMLYHLLSWQFACNPCSGRSMKSEVFPCHRAEEFSCLLPHGTDAWLQGIELEARLDTSGGLCDVRRNSGHGTPAGEDTLGLESQCVRPGRRARSGNVQDEAKLYATGNESAGWREDSCEEDRSCTENGGRLQRLDEVCLLCEDSSRSPAAADGRPTGGDYSLSGQTATAQPEAEEIDHRNVLMGGILGFALIITHILIDLADGRSFDEKNIRRFISKYKLTDIEVSCYWLYVALIFWGLFSSITTCVVFHALCSEMRRAIDLAGRILRRCTESRLAARRIDELAQFLVRRQSRMSVWFTVHTLCFSVVLFIQLYYFLPTPDKHHRTTADPDTNITFPIPLIDPNDLEQHWYGRSSLAILSEAASIAIILFKFFYPLFQAASVTQHWNKVVPGLNENNHMRLEEKNNVITHWQNYNFAYKMIGVRVTGGRAIAFGLSLFLLFVKAVKYE